MNKSTKSPKITIEKEILTETVSDYDLLYRLQQKLTNKQYNSLMKFAAKLSIQEMDINDFMKFVITFKPKLEDNPYYKSAIDKKILYKLIQSFGYTIDDCKLALDNILIRLYSLYNDLNLNHYEIRAIQTEGYAIFGNFMKRIEPSIFTYPLAEDRPPYTNINLFKMKIED